jgi:hypothetical protein
LLHGVVFCAPFCCSLAALQGAVCAWIAANAVATDEATEQLHIAAMFAAQEPCKWCTNIWAAKLYVFIVISWQCMLVMLQGSCIVVDRHSLNNLAALQGVVLHVLALVANAVATDEATEQLHIAAMLAIRNSASGAPTSVRQDILATISWQRMLAMLRGSCDILAVHAWRTLQNLCHSMDGQNFAKEVLQWSGVHLLELAVDLIQGLTQILHVLFDPDMLQQRAALHSRAQITWPCCRFGTVAYILC